MASLQRLTTLKMQKRKKEILYLSMHQLIRKNFRAGPLFIYGAEDLIYGADYDGGDFGKDVIEMGLVNFNTLTHLHGINNNFSGNRIFCAA